VTNALYPLWKQGLLTEAIINKSLDQTGPNAPYLALVTIGSGGYGYSASHQFYTDLTNIQGTPQPITGNTVLNGLFAGATVVFANVTGTPVGALVIYRQNPLANTTWRLVFYQDTGVVGLPVTANGGNIIAEWDVAGIFQL
jgi:hypothetical protein